MKDDNNWLTPKEAARYLGVSVCTIHRYLKQKENPLPCIYFSKRTIRINVDKLEEWISTYNLGEDN